MVKLAIRAQPYCGRCGSTEDLTGDHIVPLSEGGMNALSNIGVLCRSCNAQRGTGALTAPARPQPRFSRRAELVLECTVSPAETTKALRGGHGSDREKANSEPFSTLRRVVGGNGFWIPLAPFLRYLGTAKTAIAVFRLKGKKVLWVSGTAGSDSTIQSSASFCHPVFASVYSGARRIGPRERECIDCGASFTAAKREPAGERCRLCRRARKLRQPGRSGPYDSPTGQGGGDQPVGWLIPSHLQPARSGRTPPAPPEASLANVSAHFPSWSTTLMNLPS